MSMPSARTAPSPARRRAAPRRRRSGPRPTPWSRPPALRRRPPDRCVRRRAGCGRPERACRAAVFARPASEARAPRLRRRGASSCARPSASGPCPAATSAAGRRCRRVAPFFVPDRRTAPRRCELPATVPTLARQARVQRAPSGVSSTTTPRRQPVADRVRGREVAVLAASARASSSARTSSSSAPGKPPSPPPSPQCGSSGSTPSTSAIARTARAAPRARGAVPGREGRVAGADRLVQDGRAPPGCRGRRPSPGRRPRAAAPRPGVGPRRWRPPVAARAHEALDPLVGRRRLGQRLVAELDVRPVGRRGQREPEHDAAAGPRQQWRRCSARCRRTCSSSRRT